MGWWVNTFLSFLINFYLKQIKIDTKTCFEYVYNTIKDTPADFCLLSILHHLLLIRDDINIRYSYYRLIEDCVAKIVLFKDGRDPDFECGSKFDLDVDSIISKYFIFFILKKRHLKICK